ncbi:hypothetical protein G7059_08015 [Erysipelothrix sp. HDW6A]|uniref:hypothetical protein n=1 Tax=Erysipelothrix sp. HDW6A TaxID=2714928 RepID=UPI00140C9E32|nr:hypothetical protein [Erysipelothrix sp. HDW6A]QIK57787.1 hypothetical protein G7059_08015 [Erysipelothrix sp. HDW6A]
MNRAEWYFARLMFQAEEFDITYNDPKELIEVEKLYSEIDDYLNRKDKLVVGSEWVCDANNWSYDDTEYYESAGEIKEGQIVTISKIIEGYIQTNEYRDDSIPLGQFLACFSPKKQK